MICVKRNKIHIHVQVSVTKAERMSGLECILYIWNISQIKIRLKCDEVFSIKFSEERFTILKTSNTFWLNCICINIRYIDYCISGILNPKKNLINYTNFEPNLYLVHKVDCFNSTYHAFINSLGNEILQLSFPATEARFWTHSSFGHVPFVVKSISVTQWN